ncbi:unnamed protein product [Strongylus vulgaris]|uniref:Uncharacterized protein n=1 Tax=Strongylus vulgaris TaxID=40348 RepID=A0A3P7L8U5_STRVU|nr:unnamed protein product [Strongylus vulgaris]
MRLLLFVLALLCTAQGRPSASGRSDENDHANSTESYEVEEGSGEDDYDSYEDYYDDGEDYYDYFDDHYDFWDDSDEKGDSSEEYGEFLFDNSWESREDYDEFHGGHHSRCRGRHGGRQGHRPQGRPRDGQEQGGRRGSNRDVGGLRNVFDSFRYGGDMSSGTRRN